MCRLTQIQKRFVYIQHFTRRSTYGIFDLNIDASCQKSVHHLQVTLLTCLEQLLWVLGENNTRKNSPHGERDPNMYIRMLNMTSKIVLKKSNTLFSLKIKLRSLVHIRNQNLQSSISGNCERQINHRSYTRNL